MSGRHNGVLASAAQRRRFATLVHNPPRTVLGTIQRPGRPEAQPGRRLRPARPARGYGPPGLRGAPRAAAPGGPGPPRPEAATGSSIYRKNIFEDASLLPFSKLGA